MNWNIFLNWIGVIALITTEYYSVVIHEDFLIITSGIAVTMFIFRVQLFHVEENNSASTKPNLQEAEIATASGHKKGDKLRHILKSRRSR